MFKLSLVFFFTMMVCSSGLILDQLCRELSKNFLCRKFFDPPEREECVKEIEPVYKWVFLIFNRKISTSFQYYLYDSIIYQTVYLIQFENVSGFINYVPHQVTLEVCITRNVYDHRCADLKSICPNYVYVAVYLPGWPADREYTFSCTTTLLGSLIPLLCLLFLMGCSTFFYLRSRRGETETSIWRPRSNYGTLK